MAQKIKAALRSSRSSVFREPRRAVSRRRSQRVKFRPRYAKSMLRQTGVTVWKVARIILFIGVISLSAYYGFRFWNTAAALRVASVQFGGDIPPQLRRSFGVKVGDHLLTLRPRRMQRDLLFQFSELQHVTIRRTMSGDLQVSGVYRRPAALIEKDGHLTGVDAQGVLFPIGDHNPAPDNRPRLHGVINADQAGHLVDLLSILENDTPRFYSMVKSLETDNIGAVRMILDDGTVIEWGEMKKENLKMIAQNILLLKQRFAPVKTPATLRIITANRIVMDSNWTQIKKG